MRVMIPTESCLQSLVKVGELYYRDFKEAEAPSTIHIQNTNGNQDLYIMLILWRGKTPQIIILLNRQVMPHCQAWPLSVRIYIQKS